MPDPAEPQALKGQCLLLVDGATQLTEGHLRLSTRRRLRGWCFGGGRLLRRRRGFLRRLRALRVFRRCHPTISSSSLPRRRATVAGSFNIRSAANVARTTLCALAEPIDLVSTLWM